MTINARFDGGAAHGHFERFAAFEEFLTRNGEDYRAGYYEDGSPARSGNTVLVYHPHWVTEDEIRQGKA